MGQCVGHLSPAGASINSVPWTGATLSQRQQKPRCVLPDVRRVTLRCQAPAWLPRPLLQPLHPIPVLNTSALPLRALLLELYYYVSEVPARSRNCAHQLASIVSSVSLKSPLGSPTKPIPRTQSFLLHSERFTHMIS